MGARYCPLQFGLLGFERAAKSSPGVGMLMASFLIALASCSVDNRGDSAPITAQMLITSAIAQALGQAIMVELSAGLTELPVGICPTHLGAQPAMASDFITVVSGLPRSGTSLMMQMLRAGGIPPLTDNLRAADEDNPRGYFEFEPVKRLRADRSWLDRARGRAVKIIHLLVRELPRDGQFQYRVILMKRPMEEILASQRVMLERQGKTSADETLLAKTFHEQLSQLEEWLRARQNFAVLAVHYHDLLESTAPTTEKIDNFLGGGLDIAAMTRAVDPALYRQRPSAESK